MKKPITIRLDEDVIAWFKSGGEGYQTRINEVLRFHMNKLLGNTLEPDIVLNTVTHPISTGNDLPESKTTATAPDQYFRPMPKK